VRSAVRDYLDEDVAYFVGLLVGRGEIAETQDRWIAVIDFPFVRPNLEGFDRFADFFVQHRYDCPSPP